MAILKESKFLTFKGLTTLFDNPKDQLIIEKERINKKVSILLEVGQFNVVFDYMIAGYLLDDKQKENLVVDIYRKISQEDSLKAVNTAIKKGIHFTDDILVRLLPMFKLSELPGDRFGSIAPEFNKVYKEKLKNLDFTYYYDNWLNDFNKFSKIIKNPFLRNDKIENTSVNNVLNNFIEYSDYMFKNIGLDVVMDHIESSNKIYKTLENIRDSVSNSQYSARKRALTYIYDEINKKYLQLNRELSQLPAKLYTNDLETEKKQIGLLYSEDNINQLIAENDLKISSQNNVKNLPENAKNILDNIKNDYLLLNKKLEDLNEDEKFTIDNFWNKRIPEVLNKYLRADPEFRSTMKNSRGESIEDLMIDSLNNIYEKLKEIKMDHGENTLRDMSAINRYTKTFKK